MSTKQNPGPFDCYAKLAPDEPYFVLRAKDPIAPEVVEVWAALREALHGDYPKLREARECAEEMRRWRAAKGAMDKPAAEGDSEETYRATLLSGDWIAGQRLTQIRRKLADAGFRPWSNSVNVGIAEFERCGMCEAPCRYEGFKAVVNNVPQRWSLAVCTACGAGLSF